MRLVTFDAGRGDSAGILAGDEVFGLGVPMEEVLRDADRARHNDAASRGRGIALRDVEIKAPIPRPGKVIAIGMNYLDHCLEQGIEPPTVPLVFAKFPSSVVGPDVAISWPEDVTQVDWEVELAVVLGASTGDGNGTGGVEIAGYTIANDVSARDLQTADVQFVRAKSLDTFCPLGPFLATPDEVPGPGDLDLSMRVNDTVVQHSNTSQLIFGVDELVRFCVHYFTLEPGDIILTGTPPGVGVFRQPPVFLAAGDEMVATIEGLGELRNPVAGPRPVA